MGNKSTHWLYQQTKRLSDFGVKLTYSGDQPFLLRLILGIDADYGTKYPSKMPMYLADSCAVKPTDVHPITKQRTDVEVQFRNDIPKESMVHFDHITAVTIDATHACIRIVEGDLQKWVNKIIGEKKEELRRWAIAALERNLTLREVKLPSFKIDVAKGFCGRVSLSGSEAQLVLAETDEFGEKDVANLFDGVWLKSERIMFDASVNCLSVLRQLHPEFFAHECISMKDIAELWRKSLYAIFRLLRSSKSVNIQAYKTWVETYYQISVLVFPAETALTPYKLKIVLYYQILKQGYLSCIWNHLTEALEKSNHHAQKFFYSKTMMGGGRLHHQNPMLLDIYFSFCRLLQISDNTDEKKIKEVISEFYESPSSSITYESIMANRVASPDLEIGCERPECDKLTGMRFLLIGNFKGATQESVAKTIESMGGTILSKSSADTILKNHTVAPHCYVIIQDDSVLRQATDTDKKVLAKSADIAKLMQTFASGNWTFLSIEFVESSNLSMTVIDPGAYKLNPGTKLQQRRVNDIRPLLKRQRHPQNSSGETTARSQIRKYRKTFKENFKQGSSSESDCSHGSRSSNSDLEN